MTKTIKILKISALAVMLTALSGCDEPQHPVYGFTQLDLGTSLMLVLLVAIVGMWVWSVWGLLDFRKNLTNQSYRGEFFQWDNTDTSIPNTKGVSNDGETR